MTDWYFERRAKMAGASGSAYRSPLTGTGHTREELISREALQNSSDALKDGEYTVSVDFGFHTLSGEEKSKFFEILKIAGDYSSHIEAQQHVSPDLLVRFRSNDQTLRLLYIDDWNTKGLGGPTHDDIGDANFFKFCLAMGDADKVDTEGAGGSYGYGKSVFAEASSVRSIIVYSVFEPTEATKGAHARLFGLTWFDKHRVANQPYTGRGFFGFPDEEEDDVFHPLSDDAAHTLAGELGFTVRDRDETGLSILVIDSQLSAEALRESIETHWWPRICENTLDVRIQENGQELEPPRPMKREDLKPFITCYRLASGIEKPLPPNQTAGKLQKIAHLEPGKWAAVALDDVDSDEEEDVDFRNKVALMRAPRMVVEYLPAGRPYRIPVAGVYIADANVDTPLKLSEPPAHDRWDPNSFRLSDASGEKQKLVETILRRIRVNVRKFQDSLLPQDDAESDRIRELEKLLGGLFNDSNPNPPPPPPHPEERPVEIRLSESREADGDDAICRAAIRIRIREEADLESDIAQISGAFQVLAQDTQSVDENLKTSVTSYPQGATIDEEKASIRLSIYKDDWQEIEFISEKFDPDWFVRFSLSAEKADA